MQKSECLLIVSGTLRRCGGTGAKESRPGPMHAHHARNRGLRTRIGKRMCVCAAPFLESFIALAEAATYVTFFYLSVSPTQPEKKKRSFSL
jgi:hypothetical protein